MKKITIRPLELSLFLFAGSLLIASLYTLEGQFYKNAPGLSRLLYDLGFIASILEIALRLASCAFMFLYFKSTREKFALAFASSVLIYSFASLVAFFSPSRLM